MQAVALWEKLRGARQALYSAVSDGDPENIVRLSVECSQILRSIALTGDRDALDPALSILRTAIDHPSLSTERRVDCHNEIGLCINLCAWLFEDINAAGVAIIVLKRALDDATSVKYHHGVVNALNNLSHACATAGALGDDDAADHALEGFKLLSGKLSSSEQPLMWARAHVDLCGAVSALRADDADWRRLGLTEMEIALGILKEHASEQEWALAQVRYADLLMAETLTNAAGTAVRAEEALIEALLVFTKERAPQRWAHIQIQLGALYADTDRLDAARARFDEGVAVLSASGVHWRVSVPVLGRIAAGVPIEALQNEIGRFSVVDSFLTGSPDWYTPARSERRPPQSLHASCFAPPSARPADTFLYQVWLHTDEQGQLAAEAARAAESDTIHRGKRAIGPTPEGATIRVTIECHGAQVADAEQSSVWRGDILGFEFPVLAPELNDGEERSVAVTCRVFIADVPVARQSTVIRVTKSASIERDLQRALAPTYQRAFLSHSHHDRERVLSDAQVLNALGIETYVDVLERPGAKWEQRLRSEIERADVVLLYWSEASSKSEWVLRETQWLTECIEKNGEDRPHLVPVILDGPPPPAPPPHLAHIHFNDPIRCVIAAHTASSAARSG